MGFFSKFSHKKSHEEWLAQHPDKQVLHMKPSSNTGYDDATRRRIEQEMEDQRHTHQ